MKTKQTAPGLGRPTGTLFARLGLRPVDDIQTLATTPYRFLDLFLTVENHFVLAYHVVFRPRQEQREVVVPFGALGSDRKSTRLNSSHQCHTPIPSSALKKINTH